MDYRSSERRISGALKNISDLEHFIISLCGPRLPEYGLRDEDIPVWLPFPLRRLYQFAGNWPCPNPDIDHMPGKIPRLFQAQDCLAGVEQIQLTDGGKSLQFFFENQDNWCCKTSINDDSTYFDDPPVYSNSGELFSSEMVGFTRVSPSLSTFLITACLHEMVFSARYLFSGDHGYSTEELLPLWLNGPYAYPDETYSFYLAYGKVLIMNNWVAFNDPDAASLIPDFSTLKYIGRGMPDFGIPPADTL